jgi:peptidoglycan/LPS O-acetylase OafA/YrhL
MSASLAPNDKYKGYVPELNAIRAVAVCVVAIGHTFPARLSPLLAHAFEASWAFIDAFFVLSGFLIAGILLDTKGKPGALSTYFRRRALRILPMYYVVLGLMLLASLILSDRMPGWGSPLWFLVYLGNIPTAVSGQMPPGLHYSYTPLWSLQIEEQFYLIFPFLVWFMSARSLSRFLLMLLPMGVLLRVGAYLLWPANDYLPAVLMPTHLDGLAIGALIAIRYRERPWHLSPTRVGWWTVLWTAILLGVMGYGRFDLQSVPNRIVGYLVASILSGHVLVWLIETRGSAATAWCRTRSIHLLSQGSYSIYLTHWPISVLITFGLLPFLDRETVRVITFLTTFPVALVVAQLSWKYIEAPMLRHRQPSRPAQPQTVGILA